jgi:ribonuclease I
MILDDLLRSIIYKSKTVAIAKSGPERVPMTLFRLRLSWFLAVALLLQTPTAYATDWLLALTWHPAFCSPRTSWPECEAAFPRLVLHGLWQQGSAGEQSGALSCEVAPGLRALDRQGKWCDLPPVALTAETANAADAVMPGRRACLDRHEWYRHGRCSGLAPDAYFSRAASLAARAADLTVSRLLVARAGGSVMLSELMHAVQQDFGPAASRAVAVVCSRHDGVARLTELRILMDEEHLHLFPAPESLSTASLKGGRRCPARVPIVVEGRT